MIPSAPKDILKSWYIPWRCFPVFGKRMRSIWWRDNWKRIRRCGTYIINYAPVTINNNFKSRSSSKFSYIFCISAQLASTQSFCLWSPERIIKEVDKVFEALLHCNRFLWTYRCFQLSSGWLYNECSVVVNRIREKLHSRCVFFTETMNNELFLMYAGSGYGRTKFWTWSLF